MVCYVHSLISSGKGASAAFPYFLDWVARPLSQEYWTMNDFDISEQIVGKEVILSKANFNHNKFSSYLCYNVKNNKDLFASF